jgi:hypothetical protein
MYLDGEADSTVSVHLASCPYCRQQADQLARLQNTLTARLFRLECPSTIELGDYQLGVLPSTQSREVKRHLDHCLLCTRELDQLRLYLSEAPVPVKTNLLEQARVLVARLIDESLNLHIPGATGLAPAYATLRGEFRGPFTYQADGILVIVDFQPTTNDRYKINGQIAADDQLRWTGAQVELRQQETFQLVTEVDDLGGFHFTGTLSGLTELRIIPTDGPIILLNFEITS